MKPAYSYQRFSSIKQKGGDSTSRQTDAAESFAKQFKLELRQTFSDEGVSGFKGKNFSNESALSAFLKLVDSGDIPKGGVLIVENMDRLSRQSILPCLSKFIEIINRGVSIGVISQGKILDEKSITENPMELMLVLVEFARANNESDTKSKRAKSVIKKKIELVKDGNKVWFGVQKPSWIIGLKDGKFIEDKSRVRVVQGIELFRRNHGWDRLGRLTTSRRGGRKTSPPRRSTRPAARPATVRRPPRRRRTAAARPATAPAAQSPARSVRLAVF